MRRTLTHCLIVLAALFAATGAAHAEREMIDKIVAVVGNEVILSSELTTQVQMAAFQSGRRPKNDAEFAAMQKEVLDQMISEQLFLIEARKDTSISVRPEEVDQALDEQVARVAGRFNSNEEFLTALAQEGLTLRDLKKRYRGDLENQMLKQRLIQKKLADVSVSRHEVEEFYHKFKDSIPNQPEGVKLAHILLTYHASPVVEDSVKLAAEKLRQRILEGADFASISAQFSSLGAGANGGDLGYVGKDDVVPEFARAAFALNPGEISGVIRTQFGYHIIKCEGRQDDKLRLRHVLLAVAPSAADSARTMQLADSLLKAVQGGADFGELAKTFSNDNDTRATGGELGWYAISQLPPDFVATVSGWQTAGEYRGPVKSQYGLHILKLLEYQPSKTYTLESDFDRIKELARQDKTGKLVDKWLAQIKTRTYIDNRLEG
ncbi:MAG: peptidylprolyl isomerase [Candidatus Zixiibacteriota bacterium]